MKIATGKQVGNGQEYQFSAGYRTSAAFAVSEAAQPAAVWSRDIWCNRTSLIGAVESAGDGIHPMENGIYSGQSAVSNTNGSVTHLTALARSKNVDFETGNYMGNQQAGRVVYLNESKTPIALLIKRDSNRAPVLWAAGVCVKLDGSGASTGVTSVAQGSFTVDASNETNEYVAAGGLGEGTEYWAFFDGGSAQVAQWSGGQAVGAVAVSAPGRIRHVVIVDTLGTAAAITITDTMAAGYGKQGSAALAAIGATIDGSRLTLSSGAANTAGKSYVAVVLYDVDSDVVNPPPAIITKGKRAIWLPGRDIASYIDCGTSDATLKIAGAISIEYFGVPFFPQGVGVSDGGMISRGGGSFGAAGSVSWGLEIFQAQFASLHWQNTMMAVCVSDRWGISGSLTECHWRSGTMGPMNLPAHWLVTHNGTGGWKLYRNGGLVNQRNIDMTNTSISQSGVGVHPNIQSTAGHKTVIGARYGTSAVGFMRQAFMQASVYNRELSIAEAESLYAVTALGAAKSGDVTSGLAERWDASNAGGTFVPATVNSANNGTINYGSVITL